MSASWTGTTCSGTVRASRLPASPFAYSLFPTSSLFSIFSALVTIGCFSLPERVRDEVARHLIDDLVIHANTAFETKLRFIEDHLNAGMTEGALRVTAELLRKSAVRKSHIKSAITLFRAGRYPDCTVFARDYPRLLPWAVPAGL